MGRAETIQSCGLLNNFKNSMRMRNDLAAVKRAMRMHRAPTFVRLVDDVTSHYRKLGARLLILVVHHAQPFCFYVHRRQFSACCVLML
jgi:hypothetical protein